MKYALALVKSDIINDFVFAIIAFGLIVYTFYLYFKNTKIELGNLLIILFFLVVYLVHRFTGFVWEFTEFSLWSKLKYADILILWSVCLIILFFRIFDNKKSEGDKEEMGLLQADSSLDPSKGKDLLGYKPYAQKVADRILESNFDKAFAVGINGIWGMGKTSFINIMKDRIKGRDKNILEIDFNPWNSNSSEAIIKDFFTSVHSKIHPSNSSLSKLILKYSDKLVQIHKSNSTQFVKSVLSSFFKEKSINDLFSEINDSLEKSKSKLIIYIDDVDRLDKDEIIEVLRLIRNTANFINTVFIVAYDRNYVVNALNLQNQSSPEKFLEKIFQIEITLPLIERYWLRKELVKQLKELFPNPKKLHTEFELAILGGRGIINPEYLDNWLTSLRDVTRLCNSLVFNYKELIGEVKFDEFLKTELIRLEYPHIHRIIFKYPENFLERSYDESTGRDFYTIKKISQSEQKKRIESFDINEGDSKYRHYLEKYITENASDFFISFDEEIDKILSLIQSIFHESSPSYDKAFFLSIRNPSRFKLYSTYSMISNILSETEFDIAKNSSKKSFFQKISYWIELGIESHLKMRFGEISEFKDREEFEKVFGGIFHLANLERENHSSNYRNLIGFDFRNLSRKFINYKSRYEGLYNGNIEELKEFIYSLFENAPPPYDFESSFIDYLLNEYYSQEFIPFPINREELQNMNLQYFEKYLSYRNKFDQNIWYLFHRTKIYMKKEVKKGAYQKGEMYPMDSKNLLIAFIREKDLNGFLESIIYRDNSSWNEVYKIDNTYQILFKGKEEFENFINQFEDKGNPVLREFKAFYKKYKNSNFQPIGFEFKYIRK